MTCDMADTAQIVRSAEQEGLWSPVETVESLLAGGDPHSVAEPLARSLLRVDFAGKSVVDLGSNIGLYAFLAAMLGAKEVQALDFGPDVVRLGNHLAQKYGLQQVSFVEVDFGRVGPWKKWDLAMMLNIIGNNKVRKGRVAALMDTLLGYSQKELLCNVRPVYSIEQELGVPPEALQDIYPQQHLRGGKLHLLEHLQARYGQEWDIRMLAKDQEASQQDKPALHFLRR